MHLEYPDSVIARREATWQSIPIERIVHCPCVVSVLTCRDRNDKKNYKVQQAAIILNA
jgi:hypothetical protein